jgi:hypothetical protein
VKRGQPLARRTPLRARTGLARTGKLVTKAELRRTTPLRPVSAKQAAKIRRRRAVIAGRGTGRPLCSVPWCPDLADDIHEPLTRGRGGRIDDRANMAPLCRPCHDVITFTEPAWAYALGLLVHSWDQEIGA